MTLAEDPDGPFRAVLGPLADDLLPCAGRCGDQLLRWKDWRTLDAGKRKRLRVLRVNRASSFGRCWKCAENGAEKAPVENQPSSSSLPRPKNANRIPAEILSRLPEIWAEVRVDGGGVRQFAGILGVTRERARQLVVKHDLPRTRTLGQKAQVFLEELEHLAGLGMGVKYIADALGMTPEGLARKVNHLYETGKTEVHFPGWHRRREEKEAA